jgi:pimeloyl-ACP methyl ester carboxylesterase
MLHGGGSSGAQSFERQIKAFAAHRRIIAPDQVGQGRTPDVAGPLSYTAMLDDTRALLHQLGVQRLDVMGFSDGGILALMLAAREPALVHRMVVSGVNVAPEGLNPDDLQQMRAVPPAVAALTIDDKLRELWMNSPTPLELNLQQLESIEQPVLVMSGDHDAVQLAHTLAIYQALPNAELCVLPGTTHDTFGGRPEWVNPIAAAFLARRD